eukprot:1891575-Amphidinium_carterae.1
MVLGLLVLMIETNRKQNGEIWRDYGECRSLSVIGDPESTELGIQLLESVDSPRLQRVSVEAIARTKRVCNTTLFFTPFGKPSIRLRTHQHFGKLRSDATVISHWACITLIFSTHALSGLGQSSGFPYEVCNSNCGGSCPPRSALTRAADCGAGNQWFAQWLAGQTSVMPNAPKKGVSGVLDVVRSPSRIHCKAYTLCKSRPTTPMILNYGLNKIIQSAMLGVRWHGCPQQILIPCASTNKCAALRHGRERQAASIIGCKENQGFEFKRSQAHQCKLKSDLLRT